MHAVCCKGRVSTCEKGRVGKLLTALLVDSALLTMITWQLFAEKLLCADFSEPAAVESTVPEVPFPPSPPAGCKLRSVTGALIDWHSCLLSRHLSFFSPSGF